MMNSNTSLWFYSSEQRYYAGAYFITMLSLSFLFLISGSFYYSFGAIDSILMIYFLFFTTTSYPANVADLSKLFGRFLYDFVPNFISDYLDTSTVTSNPPNAFKLNGFGGFYLDNTSLSCEIIGLFLGLYCLVKLLSYIPILSLQIWIRRSILQRLEFDSFVYIFWIFSHQFAIFSLIQLQHGLSFSSTAEIVSSTILIITGPVIGLAPLLILYKICKWRVLFQNPESHLYNRIKALSLLRGLKIKIQKREQGLVLHEQKRRSKLFYVDSFDAFSASTGDDLLKDMKNQYSLNQQKHFSDLCKYTNVILLIRRMAFVLAIVFLQDHLYAQMSVISGFNAVLFLFFTTKKPYISRLDNPMNSLIELLFIALQAMICLFDSFTDHSLLIKFGWTYVYLVFIILGLRFLSFLKKSYSILRSFFENKPTKVKQNKVVPSTKHDTPTEKVGPRFGDHIFIGSLRHNLDTTSNSTPMAQQNNSKLNILSLTPTPVNKPTPILEMHTEQTQIEKSLPTEQTALQTDSQFFTNSKISEKVSSIPKKFANVSFSSELHFDYSENMKSRKQRLKKLFFKRNPFISQEDQDLAAKEKDNYSRTTAGRQGSSFLFQS